MKVTAVVLAGGKMLADDPLFSQGKDGRRSLIPIGGKPMVQWVIDALEEAESPCAIYVVGIPDDYDLKLTKPHQFLPDHGSMFENIRQGVLKSAEDYPDIHKVLLASADIPAVRPDMVDWLVDEVSQSPEMLISYNVISQALMESRFPGADRSYVRFKDGAVCGGDLNVVDQKLFLSERPIWKRLTMARKHPMKQAMILGLDTLLLVFLRLITLDTAVRRISQRLALKAQAIRSPFAEIGMDADKPHQLAILRREMERHQ